VLEGDRREQVTDESGEEQEHDALEAADILYDVKNVVDCPRALVLKLAEMEVDSEESWGVELIFAQTFVLWIELFRKLRYSFYIQEIELYVWGRVEDVLENGIRQLDMVLSQINRLNDIHVEQVIEVDYEHRSDLRPQWHVITRVVNEDVLVINNQFDGVIEHSTPKMLTPRLL
jgi:hypothetical protein